MEVREPLTKHFRILTAFNSVDINALHAKLAIHTGTSEWQFDVELLLKHQLKEKLLTI